MEMHRNGERRPFLSIIAADKASARVVANHALAAYAAGITAGTTA